MEPRSSTDVALGPCLKMQRCLIGQSANPQSSGLQAPPTKPMTATRLSASFLSSLKSLSSSPPSPTATQVQTELSPFLLSGGSGLSGSQEDIIQELRAFRWTKAPVWLLPGGERARKGDWLFEAFSSRSTSSESDPGVMTTISALWVLLLCQLLTSSSGQVGSRQWPCACCIDWALWSSRICRFLSEACDGGDVNRLCVIIY